MNYFEFYGLPVAFRLDEAQLRRLFYENSKKYHPDFHTLASAEEQEAMLHLSTLNNEAYQTLADSDRRMRYVLEIKGLLADEAQQRVPQEFLLEMMDINEALMELEMDYDPERFEQTAQAIANWERALDDAIAPVLDRYADDSPHSREDLLQVRDYFLKKRYLLRIREKLATFAAR
jgi:molecular chaperone HscB